MKNDTVTTLDVAERAGVGCGKVSQAIHNTGNIKADTCKKIEKELAG